MVNTQCAHFKHIMISLFDTTSIHFTSVIFIAVLFIFIFVLSYDIIFLLPKEFPGLPPLICICLMDDKFSHVSFV